MVPEGPASSVKATHEHYVSEDEAKEYFRWALMAYIPMPT